MTSHVATATTPKSEPHSGVRDRVVAGVDASAHAAAAAAWAAQEARVRGVPLILAHAARPPHAARARGGSGHRAQGLALLAAAAARVRAQFPGLRVDTTLCEAAPDGALAELSENAALLVLGTRGHGALAGMLVGSVTRKLARHARCPLVVVPAASDGPVHGTRDEVVLGIGPHPCPAAARYACETARRWRASVTAVRAWWPTELLTAIAAPGGRDTAEFAAFRDAANADVAPALVPLRDDFADVPVGTVIVEGEPVPALVEHARGARLLVLGTHRRRGPFAQHTGYVVDGVLGCCPAPVAVVPAGDDAENRG